MNLSPYQLKETALLIDKIILEIEQRQGIHEQLLEGVCEHYQKSASNLLDYKTFRTFDVRALQEKLKTLGLTRLANAEGNILGSLLNLREVIRRLGGERSMDEENGGLSIGEGNKLLKNNTQKLFSANGERRRVRIMVTQPSEAAHDYQMVLQMVQNGMDCARINCAHDTPENWLAMIKNLRQAESELGRSCKVFMDIGGPKPRLEKVLLSKNKQRIHQEDKLLLSEKAPLHADKKIFKANCTIPEILPQLKLNNQVWIDDGKIGGKVKSILPEGVLLEITHARSKGEKLRPDKGINFPDTLLNLNPLTSKDQKDLDFIVTHADIIGYSFVQEATDIELLQLELQARLGANSCQPAIVAKIETAEAVKNLPELIVRAAGKQPFGVMIARGDLAVEIGYQRLAEIQEEILWLCQAAHVPVIWATQVLENLVKKRTPSRAEMTDAAMAERAECVMLNKGAYITEALTILDDVLNRMEAHQSKKTPQLRALHSW